MPPFDITARAALFDMDGTLVDSTALVEDLWQDFAQRYDVDLSVLLPYSHGRRTLDTVRHFLPPGQDAEAVTGAMEAEELVRMEGLVEIPGAAALLEMLRDAPIAVVTSASRELALRRMGAVGLRAPDTMVTAEEIENGKPAPDGYLQAAALLGRPPSECVAFEDAEAGLRSAVAAGARVVVVGGHDSPTTADLTRIPDFRGVSAITEHAVIRFRYTA